MVGRVRFFAKSYRICVPELKSGDGNAPSLGKSWEPRKSKMAAVILVNYKMCSSFTTSC